MDVFNRLKKFVVQLFQDDQFRYHLATASEEERLKLLEQLGYRFSQQEWESGMLQILDAKERDEFEELNDEQLAALAGAGLAASPEIIAVPMYGIPPDEFDHTPRCKNWWSCLPSHDPFPPQAMYGGPSPKDHHLY
jgi:predicted ribosomally synthesized peptide with nif11-like leader